MAEPFSMFLTQGVRGGLQVHELPQIKVPHLPGVSIFTRRARDWGQEEEWQVISQIRNGKCTFHFNNSGYFMEANAKSCRHLLDKA